MSNACNIDLGAVKITFIGRDGGANAVPSTTGWRLSDAPYPGRAAHSGLRNPDLGFLVSHMITGPPG
jgi:hypothetical protein